MRDQFPSKFLCVWECVCGSMCSHRGDMVSYHIKVKFEVIGLLIPHALCVWVCVSVCMLVPVSHVSDFSCRNPHGINFVCVCWSLCECTRVEEGSRRLSEVQSSLDILLKHQVAKSRHSVCICAPSHFMKGFVSFENPHMSWTMIGVCSCWTSLLNASVNPF